MIAALFTLTPFGSSSALIDTGTYPPPRNAPFLRFRKRIACAPSPFISAPGPALAPLPRAPRRTDARSTLPSALEIAPHASLVRRGRARIGRVEQRVRARLGFERLVVRPGKHQVLVLVPFLLLLAALVSLA
jgi:hypothetical protein